MEHKKTGMNFPKGSIESAGLGCEILKKERENETDTERAEWNASINHKVINRAYSVGVRPGAAQQAHFD